MSTSRVVLSLAAIATVVIAVGCSSSPVDPEPSPSPAPSGDSTADEPAAEGADEEVGQVSSDLTFNPCACVDKSQFRDCTSGVCYCWRWNGGYEQHWCWEKYKFITCRDYTRYRC